MFWVGLKFVPRGRTPQDPVEDGDLGCVPAEHPAFFDEPPGFEFGPEVI